MSMSPRPIAKAWYLLLAANDSLRARARREPPFFALPCATLDDLATQLAMHSRFTQRSSN